MDLPYFTKKIKNNQIGSPSNSDTMPSYKFTVSFPPVTVAELCSPHKSCLCEANACVSPWLLVPSWIHMALRPSVIYCYYFIPSTLPLALSCDQVSFCTSFPPPVTTLISSSLLKLSFLKYFSPLPTCPLFLILLHCGFYHNSLMQ